MKLITTARKAIALLVMATVAVGVSAQVILTR